MIVRAFANFGRLTEVLNATGKRFKFGFTYCPESYYVRVTRGEITQRKKILKIDN
jgi:hypothetical protein